MCYDQSLVLGWNPKAMVPLLLKCCLRTLRSGATQADRLNPAVIAMARALEAYSHPSSFLGKKVGYRLGYDTHWSVLNRFFDGSIHELPLPYDKYEAKAYSHAVLRHQNLDKNS